MKILIQISQKTVRKIRKNKRHFGSERVIIYISRKENNMRHRKPKFFNQKCTQAVIFARVSSERQEQGASIDAQLKSVYDYCEKMNFNVLEEFTITESSSRGDRKQYKEMLAYIQKSHSKIAIVVNCVDRLQRSYKDTPALDEMRRNGKIEVHFLKENLILHKDSKGSDILFWNLHVLMANSYILQLSDNVKRSQKYNRMLGKWQGFAPLGYLNAKDAQGKATLIIDKVRGPIIKKMFEMYATGHESLDSILEMTHRMGLMSKAFKDRDPKPITRNTVRDILTNKFYYGIMENPDFDNPDNDEYIEVPHIYDHLIDQDLFDAVQIQLERKATQHAHPQKNGKIPFVFRGLIRCATCGNAISEERHYKKSNGKTYNFLRCSHFNADCHQKMVNENVILNQLSDEVFSKLKIPASLLKNLKDDVRLHLEKEDELNTKMKKNIEVQLKELEHDEKNLLNLYIKGKLNDTVYQTKQTEIENDRTRLNKTAEKYISIDKSMKEALEKIVDIAGHFNEIMQKADPAQKNKLLKLLLTDCFLKGDRLEYKIKKPFDTFMSNPKSKSWLKIQPETLPEYQEMTNKVLDLEVA